MYYYRRRLPGSLVACFHKQHLFLSLRTANPALARRIAVQLDARMDAIMALAEQNELPEIGWTALVESKFRVPSMSARDLLG